jgi:hypothetical protein
MRRLHAPGPFLKRENALHADGSQRARRPSGRSTYRWEKNALSCECRFMVWFQSVALAAAR